MTKQTMKGIIHAIMLRTWDDSPAKNGRCGTRLCAGRRRVGQSNARFQVNWGNPNFNLEYNVPHLALFKIVEVPV